MNFLQSLKEGAQNLFGNLFGGNKTISPLPDSSSQQKTYGQGGPAVYNYEQAASGTYKPGFIGPVPQPTSQQDTLPQGGGGGGGGNTSGGLLPGVQEDIDRLLQSMVNPLQDEIESWWKRLDEYDKSNPFAFDEALARASSEERLNPYFDATLNEFMTGVRASSRRSVEDMTRTIGELNVDATKLSDQERLSTQEAIRSSEEGFAGAGLFFGGKRARQTGLEEVQGGQAQEAIQTGLERGTSTSKRSNIRLQEDLALQEARQKRITGAERVTSLETDISKQKRESALQRGLERLQFAGKIPGASPVQQMQLENELTSGLL